MTDQNNLTARLDHALELVKHAGIPRQNEQNALREMSQVDDRIRLSEFDLATGPL